MVWEKSSNFSASFPDPINTFGFCLLSSVKGHWHAEGLLRGLNLSRYVSVCGTGAFLYLLTDRFIALLGALHKSTCSDSFPFGKLTFGLALVTATDLCCGKTWSSATKGRLWARLLDQQGQIPCAGKTLCAARIVCHPQPTLKYAPACVRRGAPGTALKTPDKREVWERVRVDDADNCFVYSSLGRELWGYKSCPRCSFAERLTCMLGLGASSPPQPLRQSYIFWI